MRRLRVAIPLLLALSALTALGAPTAFAGQSALLGSRSVRLRGAIPVLPHALALGPLSATALLPIDVVLGPTHEAQLRQTLLSLENPTSAQYHHFLTPQEFLARFGPSRSTVTKAMAWLHSDGMSPRRRGFALHLDAKVAQIESLFKVRLDRFRVGGRVIAMPSATPLVPSSLAGAIQGVVGLETAIRPIPELVRLRPPVSLARARGEALRAHASTSCVAAPMSMAQVGQAYGIPSLIQAGFNGSGGRVAVLELAAYSIPAVNAFARACGLNASNVVLAGSVDGGATPSLGASGGTLEADLDIEELMTQAPGAAIDVYEAPSSDDYDLWNAVIQADNASIISMSWGLCEQANFTYGDGTEEAVLLQQAAAQGQAIFAASGDSGSEDCSALGEGDTNLSVDFPASDPNVVGVGGTTLSGSPGAWSETTWNSSSGASGGGVSCIYPQPAYQAGVDLVTAASPSPCAPSPTTAAAPGCSGICRGVPDISANAGTGVAVVSPNASSQLSWYGIGGTSAAAPMVAGMFADIAQSCATPLGSVSNLLYATARVPGAYGVAFRDITTGNNDFTGTNGGEYLAGPGYDLATGIGSPLATGLACPQVTNVSPARAVPGAKVTVRGTNLSHASFAFNSTPAVVLQQSAQRAVLVVPAGVTSARISATTTVGQGRTTVAFIVGEGPPGLRALRYGSGKVALSFVPTPVQAKPLGFVVSLARCATWSTRPCLERRVALGTSARHILLRALVPKRRYWVALQARDPSGLGPARVVSFVAR